MIEPLPPPVPYYYPLFEHMSREHGLTLTDSEMDEIVRVVESLPKPPHPIPLIQRFQSDDFQKVVEDLGKKEVEFAGYLAKFKADQTAEVRAELLRDK